MTPADTPCPPISVVGIGCRIPGAAGPGQFWRLLLEGGADRRRGARLPDTDWFDNDWFALTEHAAAELDPRQRVALEVAVEALDDAGLGYRTRGSAAAVVFGACGHHSGAIPGLDGAALRVSADRLAAVLGLHGPNLVVDGACAAALAAVDLAARLLADPAIPFAIVGGVDLALPSQSPDHPVDGEIPDGRCVPARGDSCGVVILRRTADAIRDGSRIYAEIIGTAVGSDGSSVSDDHRGLSGRSIQRALRSAWQRAGATPRAARYIEYHSAGTEPAADALGAMIEDAAGDIRIGTPAAGIIGLIRAALAIHHGVIPLPELMDGPPRPTTPADWRDIPPAERYANVSSFGVGGANAHLALHGVPIPRHDRGDEFPLLIPLTARDLPDLHRRATHLADRLATTPPPPPEHPHPNPESDYLSARPTSARRDSVDNNPSRRADRPATASAPPEHTHPRTDRHATPTHSTPPAPSHPDHHLHPEHSHIPGAPAPMENRAARRTPGTAPTDRHTHTTDEAPTERDRATQHRHAEPGHTPSTPTSAADRTARPQRTYTPATNAAPTEPGQASRYHAESGHAPGAPAPTPDHAVRSADKRADETASRDHDIPIANEAPTTHGRATRHHHAEPGHAPGAPVPATGHAACPTAEHADETASRDYDIHPANEAPIEGGHSQHRPAESGHGPGAPAPAADRAARSTYERADGAGLPEAYIATADEVRAECGSAAHRDAVEPGHTAERRADHAARPAHGCFPETDGTPIEYAQGTYRGAESEYGARRSDPVTGYSAPYTDRRDPAYGTPPDYAQAAYVGAVSHAESSSYATGSLRAEVSGVARLFPERVRAAVVARDREDAVRLLRGLAREATGTATAGPATGWRPGGVVFLFSGVGGQHARMGRALAVRYPVFARTLTAAADAIMAASGPRIWTPRYGFALGNPEQPGAATELASCAVFAYQVAVAELLGAWGVRPDAVIGYGLGEVAGAVVSGALSLADAARVLVARSRIPARLDGPVATAFLAAPPDEVASLVAPMRAEVSIAAIDGPRSVIVSGTVHYIDTLVRRATRRGISATRTADEFPYAQATLPEFATHSPRVATALPEFLGELAGLTPRAPHTPVYATARGGALLGTALMDAGYWRDNAAHTVDLAAALEHAGADGHSTVLELAPHPLLLDAVGAYPHFRAAAYPVAVCEDEAGALLGCLARLYTEGRELDWSAHGPLITAPTRHWVKRCFPPHDAPESTIDESPFPADDLADHLVRGIPTVPGVYWLRRLLHLARTGTPSATMVADFVIHERTDLATLPAATYHRDGAASVRAQATGTGALASSRLADGPTPADIVAWMRVVDTNRARHQLLRGVSPETFYDLLRRRGLAHGPVFRPLRTIALGSDCALGTFDAVDLQCSAALEGCLQLLTAACADTLPSSGTPLPMAVESAWLATEPNRALHEAHAFVRERKATGFVGDVIGIDQYGAPAVALLGVHMGCTEPGVSSALPRSNTNGAVAPDISTVSAPSSIFRQETWYEVDPRSIGLLSEADADGPQRALIVGASALADRLADGFDRVVPTERVGCDPQAATAAVTAILAGRPSTDRMAVVLVWPPQARVPIEHEAEPDHRTAGRILELIQQTHSADATASLTVVLPARFAASELGGSTSGGGYATIPTSAALRPIGAVTDPGKSVPAEGIRPRREPAADRPAAGAIAGLIRTLQLESSRTVRLVWSDEDARTLPLVRELILSSRPEIPDELRITEGAAALRRFRPARMRSSAETAIDPRGTYVVTGGLGVLGAVAVRWLLAAGAHDVVVLTRSPRPAPPLLDGFEDRIVVVRCDIADRQDLANALNDIRECGSTVRGIVHAAGAQADAPFETVTAGHLGEAFAPKSTAARNLLELTADDPADFVLLFSSATGALGAPGQSAHAAANAAMDALARAYTDRQVISIGWGVWCAGLTETAGGTAHFRRAGLVAFDAERGGALLDQALRHAGPYLLAVDHIPTEDRSPVAQRLTNLLTPVDISRSAEPLSAALRRILASTLQRPTESIDRTADFTELGLSSILAVELRRQLETQLGIRVSTADLVHFPSIATLVAALADRVAAAATSEAL